MAEPERDAATIPVVAILGIDAALAARPATPVQLAHACLSAGYTEVYPASWGDELIAARSLALVRSRGREPAILCACPFVAERLLSAGDDLEPFIVPLVSPPVAAALYLRAMYGEDGVHVTYIGACPSGADPAIDLQLMPADLLDALRERGINLSQQPRVFNSIIPPDRRRYYSLPGGAPTAEWLERESGGRRLLVLDSDDPATELAQHLISQSPVLVDPAPCMGCVCSGASASQSVATMRQMVATIEPPTAPSTVVDINLALDLSLESPYALVSDEERTEEPPESDEPYVDVDIVPDIADAAPAPDDANAAQTDVQLEVAIEVTEAQVEIRKQEGYADLRETDLSEMVPWEEDLLSWNGDPVSPADQHEGDSPDPADEPSPITTADAYEPEPDEAVAEPVESTAPTHASDNGHRHAPRPRRVTPASVRRLSLHTPVVRTEEGRILPRAYFGQRRTPTSTPVVARLAGTGMIDESADAHAEEVGVPEVEPAVHEQEPAEREMAIDTSVEPAGAAAPQAEEEVPAETAQDVSAETEQEELPEPDQQMRAEPAAEAPVVPDAPPNRTTGGSYRSVVVPLPADRPRPVPPPPLNDRSPLAWALLAVAVVLLSVIVIRLLTSGQDAQRAASDTPVSAEQPVPNAPLAADSVTLTADSASIAPSVTPSPAPPADSAAAADTTAASLPPATPDTAAVQPDSAVAAVAAPVPPARIRPRGAAPRRVVTPRQAPLTPEERRRRFDSLARIVDSLVPASAPSPAPPPR